MVMTGKDSTLDYRRIVESADAEFIRLQDDSVVFLDRESGQTLTLYTFACTRRNVCLSVKAARESALEFAPLVRTDCLDF